MRILLISPNQELSPDPVFPLGLASIAAVLMGRGWSVRITDLCFNLHWRDALSQSLKDYQPDYLGLSIRNIDNVTYPTPVSYLSFLKEVVEACRRHSSAPIILGGSGFTLMPDALHGFLQADYGIVGEGERAILALLERLSEGSGVASLPGPIFGGSGENSSFSNPGPVDLDPWPFPARDLFDLTGYRNSGATGNLQTKRGCPFECIYCTYPLIEGRQIRPRDPQRVVEEMERMAPADLDPVFFVDNNFNYPLEQARKICQEIIKRKLGIRWTAYANPGFMTEFFMDEVKSSGCLGMEFGLDAACPDQLTLLRKNFTLKQIKESARLCRKFDVPFCFSLLFGGPGETMDSVRETLDQVEAMNPTAVIGMIGIRIFPGTRLVEIAREEGWINSDWNPLEPLFYISSGVRDHIQPLLQAFSQNHPNWIFPGLGIDLSPSKAQKMHRLGFKGPLWTYLRPKEGKKI
jgi:radical SAM superfamily enzyme YgiQ (UPF0313 family)